MLPVATLPTACGGVGLFATGAGFDATGQLLQGGEYRFGQTLAAGGTALVYGPLAGSSLWGNAAVGGAAGGTHTAVTNWVYDESKSVTSGVLVGAGAGGVGTYIGGTIGQRLQGLPRQVSVPYFQTPATITMPLPSTEAIGNTTETVISNIPALIGLPDAGNNENRNE
ncbi:hypothetical protein ACUY1T_21780 [Billgrantia sp. Q4P2]|uniref:hypothetical protein n=1 Tax=Billgrantia sp. Q4P2 TaxID=3463857 RepID=UPI00405650D5